MRESDFGLSKRETIGKKAQKGAIINGGGGGGEMELHDKGWMIPEGAKPRLKVVKWNTSIDSMQGLHMCK